MTDHAALREVAEAAVDAVAKMSAVTSGPNAVDVVKAWRHALDAYQKALRPPTVIALLNVVEAAKKRDDLRQQSLANGYGAGGKSISVGELLAADKAVHAALKACGQVEDG